MGPPYPRQAQIILSSRQIQIALLVLAAAVVSLGIYGYKLWQREEHATAAAQPKPLAATAPASGERAEWAELMVASDQQGRLEPRRVETILPRDPAEKAKQLIRLLLAAYAADHSPHPLASDADVREVFIVRGNLAVVDMNAAFAEHHPSDAAAEKLTIDSIVETLAANLPQITQVQFLIDGRERKTLSGHADLSQPIAAVRPRG